MINFMILYGLWKPKRSLLLWEPLWFDVFEGRESGKLGPHVDKDSFSSSSSLSPGLTKECSGNSGT